MSVAPRVDHFLESIQNQSEATKVRAAMAAALAVKLDEAVTDTSVGSQVAVPSISKELRAVLEEILSTNDDKDRFLEELFG